MWHTPSGNRVIRGAEADLIRVSVAVLMDHMLWAMDAEQDCLFESGIHVFDCLPVEQKLAALEQATRHLLTSTSEPLPLTAVNESVVGAVFENVRQQIEAEITSDEDWEFEESIDADFGGYRESLSLDDHSSLEDDEIAEPMKSDWRDFVINAAVQVLAERNAVPLPVDEWPDSKCVEMHKWDMLIEALADCILWDRDYEMAEAFLDDDPTNAASKRMMLGIADDYFTGLAPDPRAEQLGEVVQSIERLTRTKPR